MVLDSANFAPITITKSISLTAAPGVYAGIAVFQNDVSGVTINTPGVNVVLRGLTISGQGGFHGIYMGSGKLSIENCVISNLPTGIFAGSGAVVRIIKTLVRDNLTGIHLQGEQGGVTADISRSKFLGNNRGISLRNVSAATISDTIVTGGDIGIDVWSGFGFTSGTPRASVIRSTISNHTTAGILASAISGTASVTLSANMMMGNAKGFDQSDNGTLMSRGNNTITDNGSNTGTLTPVAPI
ncbi:MAG: right-handed parallel beta-helix repeat-containing protein [Nitrosomonas sp.]